MTFAYPPDAMCRRVLDLNLCWEYMVVRVRIYICEHMVFEYGMI
jgi:hypothetical protein